MFTTAEKTTHSTTVAQKKATENSFFRKVGEDSFFGALEASSFFSPPVQAKLNVSSPDDPQEKEADEVAEKVMRMEEPVNQLSPAEEKSDRKEHEEKEEKEEEPLQAKAETPQIVQWTAGEEEEKIHSKEADSVHRYPDADSMEISSAADTEDCNCSLQRKNNDETEQLPLQLKGRGPPAASSTFEQTLSASKGGGTSMPEHSRLFMESRFGADFSNVRIHTGSVAESLSQSINAQAFAHGRDIYFNSGKFSPDTGAGKLLLAHELTHTIQQGAVTTFPPNHSTALNAPASFEKEQENATDQPPIATLQAKEDTSCPECSAEVTQEISYVDRKEDSEEGNFEQENQTELQAKPELSSWSIGVAGNLDMGTATVSEDQNIQAKEEDQQKEKEEERESATIQPLLQKKGSYSKEKSAGLSGESLMLQPAYEAPMVLNRQEDVPSTYSQPTIPLTLNQQNRGPPSFSGTGEISIHRSVLDDALEYAGSLSDCITLDLDNAIACVKGKAQQVALHIPGYRALRVVLGEDPITGAQIDRNGRNFIEAAFDIMPGGRQLLQKLNDLQQLDAAAAWIDLQIVRIDAIVTSVSNQVERFINGLGLSDLSSPLEVIREGASIVLGFIDKVIDFAIEVASELLEMVKDFLLRQIVDFLKEQTPVYPLLTVILGKDPITGQPVARNGTNILNAILELNGEEGRQQRDQMQETGTFQRVAGYIDEGIAVFSGAYEQIVQGFRNIWDNVSIESLMDPVGTFRMIYNEFAAPVSRLLSFVLEVGGVILTFIKEVLMRRLSDYARTVRGYPLLTVLIGKDPFTEEVVPRSIPNIIRGFMSLMEGGEEQYRQMEESGAIGRATQQIHAAVARLNMTPAYVIQLFMSLWNSFSLNDLANPVEAFQRIIARFGEPIGRLIAFVVEIVKIVIRVILEIMNFPFDLISNIMTRSMAAFEQIKQDPIGFLKNLLRAIKQGFIQFFDNIGTHLMNGVVGWLMSELREANVPAPQDFSLRGTIAWVLEVLGLSMEAIWQKLAEHPRIGPERVARLRGMINTLEGIWTFIQDVQERGIAAIWEKIQEQLSNLWETVLSAVRNWVMTKIVTQVTARLLSMLDPTGIMAVMNSAIAIYSAIQSFIRYLREMLEVVNSFVNGVADIAEGNVTTAANYLEGTMGQAMPIVIGFLANQVGLSGIGRRIAEIIGAVREQVDRALTWLVNRAVNTGMNLLDRAMAMGRSARDAVLGWLGFRERFSTQAGIDHTVYVRQSGESTSLIIESSPTEMGTFLNEKESEINEDNLMESGEKRRKLGRITHGKNLLQGLQALMNNEETRENDRIPQMITEVISIVREIDSGGSVLPPESAEYQPGFSMGVKATSFSARFIQKGGVYKDRNNNDVTVPKNHPEGSEPSSGALPDAFQVLTDMRLNHRWARFHIVNADFGGAGVDSNLIPTPKYINNPDYLTQFENPLKEYYTGGLPIWIRASISYRAEFNSLFPLRYIANGGAMIYSNNEWREDTTRQETFDKSIELPETHSFNINYLIDNPSELTLVTNLSTFTGTMFDILRDNQPSGGYRYFRQMERVIAVSVLGPEALSLDAEIIERLSPDSRTTRKANDYRTWLVSVDWTF